MDGKINRIKIVILTIIFTFIITILLRQELLIAFYKLSNKPQVIFAPLLSAFASWCWIIQKNFGAAFLFYLLATYLLIF